MPPAARATGASDRAGAADASTSMPFPVETPYRMKADLTRLDGPAIPSLPDDDAMIRAKREALADRPERIRAHDAQRDPIDIARDVAAGLAVLAAQRPDRVHEGPREGAWTVTAPDGRRWSFPTLVADDPLLAPARASDAPSWVALADAAALAFAEDLVWMRDDGGAGRASLLHVSFPSHWAPDTMGGASLAALHGPVADGERLRAASAALMRAIVAKGPFRRMVWSLNPTSNLDLHPHADGPASAAPGTGAGGVRDAWFRVEVQTTLPVAAAGVALFLIRVRVAPLATVLDARAGRAARLADAIRSMSDAVLRYKGLAGRSERLLAELDRWDAART